jgi:prepilin-type N-terminal cleavage/methylation domain-containing protein
MLRLKDQKGFTLMELMVVIVIVAILAAVAVPLYINYVKDAQRTEAKGAIGAVITAEQTYYQLNGKYAATTFKRNPQPGEQNGLNCDLTESLTNWAVVSSIAGDGTGGYTVTATGQAAAAGLYVDYVYDRTTGGQWHEVHP